ncbi:MAG: tRNA (adenosine(37)-N6)-dimethylallyltransferase MiaA [Lachnospiraceae bacterium]|nr:tRNA (adenosine(37)-N6)-dimethylallyltransferase MiaA [Lachnospiraceae bacterium]
MEKQKLIILTGPTAVGKTSLSIRLAKAINGAVISADSMQVYEYMDIGSAKIRPEEMDGVDHYLVNCLKPWEPFNVVIFQQMARQAMTRIYSEGKIPILVGGTGFYIQAVLYDIDFTENDGDDTYRKELEAIARTEDGPEILHQRLSNIDPQAAEEIHPHNTKRVIRALEFYAQTSRPISEHNVEQRSKESPYDFRYFVLTDDREKLYRRIDRRVDQMISDGLAEEVRALLNMGCERTMTSMQGLGYKEIIDYLTGEITLDEAVYRIKRDTRHFAKRQLTWFKRERDVIWLDKRDYPDETQLLNAILTECYSPGI